MQLISEFPAAADRQFIDKTGLKDMRDVEYGDSALSAEIVGILDGKSGEPPVVPPPRNTKLSSLAEASSMDFDQV